MKTFAIVSVLCSALAAQVVPIPSGCSPQSPVTCVEGSTPLGYYVSFDVHNVNVGDFVTLYVGLESDPYWTPVGAMLPFNMGGLHPSLEGCYVVSPMTTGETVRSQTTYCRIPIYFPHGIVGPFVLQAAITDASSPIGLRLSDGVLYYEN